MVKIGLAIVINRPLDQVFASVSDLTNHPHWMSQILKSEKITPGPIHIGTIYRQDMDFLGGIHPTDFTITEYELNKSFSYEYTTSVFSSKDSYSFEEVAEGTRLVVRQQMQFGGVYRLSEGMVKSRVENEMIATLKNIKNALEAE